MKKLIFTILIISLAFISYSQTVSDLGIVGKYYDIKSDNNGVIHILWKDNGWAKYGQIVNRQVVNQITIPGLARNEVDHVKFRPRIAVKPDGTEIHIIWVANSQSLVHAWKNSSGTWAKTTIYSSAANKYVVYPAVTVDSAGVVHAAVTEWTQGVYNYPVKYFRKAVGSSWVKQSNLTPTDAQYRWAAMFTDSSGNVHVTWDRNKALVQYRTASSGGNLANSSTVTLPANYDRNKESDVYVDTLGNVHVAALSYNDPGYYVGIDYWSKPSGSGFNAPMHANASEFLLDGGYHPYPAVIANSLDMVAVAWGDGLSPTTVTVALYNGTEWTPEIMDTTADFKTDTRPSMAKNSTTAFLIWRSASGSISLATFDFASYGVFSPSGGEEWGFGKTYDITWNLENATGNVNINLFKNNVNLGPIVSDIANSGTYSWTIDTLESGTGIVSGTDYQIQVIAVNDSDSAMSNGNFSILPSIDITAPTAGIKWNMGSTYEITWTKTGTQSDFVNITLFKAGSAVLNIGTSADNSGSYFWDIPGTITPGVDYTISVDTVDGEVTDESEVFSILGSINVTSPSAGVEWLYGNTYSITWEVFGTMNSSVKIRLQQNGANIVAITNSTPNDGSYTWTVPSTVPSATNYVMMVKTIDSVVYDSSDEFTIAAESSGVSLTVTSPVSSSNWNSGSTQMITWNKTGTQDANVKIELFKGGSLDSTISSSTTNDGSYSWTIGSSQPTGSDYMVRITTLDDQVTDDSDQFTISVESADGITVTNPTGSSQWYHGNTYNITWTKTGTMNSFVKIRLQQNGANIVAITDITANDGSFSWTVPGTVSSASNYVIMVKTIDSLVFDTSEEFYAGETIVTPTLTITSPVSSSNWEAGSTRNITWNKTGIQDANVKIELFKGGSFDSTLSSYTTNDGSYSWAISGSQTLGSDYMVRVTTLDDALTDDSDQFTISEESADGITVTNPNSSSQWIYGNTYTITWNAVGPMNANVKIRLQQNGANIVAITNSTPNDGSYSWTVPATVPSASNYVIMVKTIDSLVFDVSDEFYIGEEVTTPTITVTNPISSSYWVTGSTYAITWNTSGTQDANVKIDLYKGGTLDSAIIGTTPNSGSYSWTIDGAQTPGTDYVVRVTTVDDQVTDDSEQFTISDTPPAGEIEITSPNSSSELNAGSSSNITWNITGSMDPNVNIYLYENGNFHSNIVMSTPNDGSYSWSLSSGLSSSNRYMVRVETVDAQITDDSNLFKIFGTGITIDMPEAGDTLTKGSNINITWKKVGSQNSYVKIRLQRNGANIATLTDRTANDGSFNWNVPATLINNSNYYFMVKTVDNLIYDTSSNLRVANAGILVNSPSTNNVLKRGSQYTINWTKTGSQNANVKLRVFQGGVQILSITDSTTNDGSYTWTVPADIATGNNIVIRVKTTDDLVSDDSGLFTIED